MEKSTITSPTLLNNAVSVMRTEVQHKIQTSIQNNLHTDAGVQTSHSGSILNAHSHDILEYQKVQHTQDFLCPI
jgi:hypothetical protein